MSLVELKFLDGLRIPTRNSRRISTSERIPTKESGDVKSKRPKRDLAGIQEKDASSADLQLTVAGIRASLA